MIRYTDTLENITPAMLTGFFQGWPHPPSPQRHLQILKNSSYVVLAMDDERNRVVGFINAISDGILCAYIPLLEVLPEYRRQGIGKELTNRMLARLKNLYMIDLVCDESLAPFYVACGMSPAAGMVMRNYETQSGT